METDLQAIETATNRENAALGSYSFTLGLSVSSALGVLSNLGAMPAEPGPLYWAVLVSLLFVWGCSGAFAYHFRRVWVAESKARPTIMARIRRTWRVVE